MPSLDESMIRSDGNENGNRAGDGKMTQVASSTSLSQPLLARLFSVATHEASVAMGRWTGGQISLTFEAVRELSLVDACEAVSLGDDLLTMVALTLAPPYGGIMILCFNETSGRQLAALLLGQDETPQGEISSLEQSALCETGNILSCAYLNAITRLTDCPLIPSPPQFLRDFGASVFEQALLSQAADEDLALVCQTTFRSEGRELDWQMLFVPSPALRNEMLRGGVKASPS